MSRGAMTLLLVAVLAIAVSAPAFGDGESLVDRALGLAQSAERKAGVAKRQARLARRQATAAKRIARQGRRIARRKAARGPAGPPGPTGATGAAGPAGPPGPPGPSAATAFAQQAGSVSTDSTAYVALGGPSVTVDVPESGQIEVAAQATLLDDSDDDGAVALFEDGDPVPGQADCGPAGGALFTLPSVGGELVGGTPASAPFCSTFGPPAAVRFVVSPGSHTYELRYAVCCGTGTASFGDRRLWVTPLP